jgi:hypothetical protein
MLTGKPPQSTSMDITEGFRYATQEYLYIKYEIIPSTQLCVRVSYIAYTWLVTTCFVHSPKNTCIVG